MNLSGLLTAIREQSAYASALAAISVQGETEQKDPPTLDLPHSARAPVLAALAADTCRPLLLLTSRSDRALEIQDELSLWQPELPILLFAEPNTLFYERTVWEPSATRQRLACLAAFAYPMLRGDHRCGGEAIIIASARALMTLTLPPAELHQNTQVLRIDDSIRLSKLLAACQAAGYAHQSMVVEPGQYSRRGGIVDIWPPSDSFPVRMELFGDQVEHMRRFDPASQRSGDSVDEVIISPAREALPDAGPSIARCLADCWPRSGLAVESGNPNRGIRAEFDLLAEGACFPQLEYYLPWLYPEQATLFDYLPCDCLVVADDWHEFVDSVEELEEQALELRHEQIDAGLLPRQAPAPHVSWSDLQDQLSTSSLLILGGGDHELPPEMYLGSVFSPSPRFAGQIKLLLDYLQTAALSEHRVVIVTRQAARLAELWGENDTYLPPVETVCELPRPSSLIFVDGTLGEGFMVGEHDHAPLNILTDAEIFGWRRTEPRQHTQRRLTTFTPEDSFAEFQSGDLVVHMEYGIGRYHGLMTRRVDGVKSEYIHVEYAGGDDLYVPVSRIARLTRYLGVDGKSPELSQLGATQWIRVRERTRQAVDEVARELLDLYAKRAISKGHSFSPDSPWQTELEASFPYVDTEDQRVALTEVKRDMERVSPMDRLICGDVGYGKTEVALRAAFKSVMGGKQVVVLTPTTVLAQQHFHTFQRRLAAFPVNVQMLSRFCNPAQQREIIAGLVGGRVDIVVGTHRILQSDVCFHDLGLVVIDEEQRFGVTHKEHLKQLRTEVDVLSLTATPIPRTLYLSLTGVRDISTINSPPEERLPVVTHVGPFNRDLVRQAVLRELGRQGQVFYVHNRVQTIGAAERQLATIVPEARLAIAHGQMPEHQLEKVMNDFTKAKHDVLVCTSIIESGLDIPNVNTLIVERAELFGLAQLYQLRGRVGRRAKQGHAYFYYQTQRHFRMTPKARQRLDTIADHTELGVGYTIAMRDLEIRGAGDILGNHQHGHIAAVGFHLYARLLRRAVQQLKVQLDEEQPPVCDLSLVTVDLPLDVNISSDYIADQRMRIRLYHRMADLDSEQSLSDMAAEINDRFGPLPDAVQNLLFQLRLRILVYRAGIESVGYERGMILLRSRAWEISEAHGTLAAMLPSDARVTRGKVWLPCDQDPRVWKQELLNTLGVLADRKAVET